MKNIPTSELDKSLEKINCRDISKYLEENKEYLTGTENDFGEYFKAIIRKNKITQAQIYREFDFNYNYGNDIIRRATPGNNRDLIISFCILGKFNLSETNTALKLHDDNPLYSKVPRDIVLITAINNNQRKLTEINKLLVENGHPVLEVNLKHI